MKTYIPTRHIQRRRHMNIHKPTIHTEEETY